MNHPLLIGNKEIYSKQLQAKNKTFMGGPDLHTILVRKTFLQLAQGTIEGFDTEPFILDTNPHHPILPMPMHQHFLNLLEERLTTLQDPIMKIPQKNKGPNEQGHPPPLKHVIQISLEKA